MYYNGMDNFGMACQALDNTYAAMLATADLPDYLDPYYDLTDYLIDLSHGPITIAWQLGYGDMACDCVNDPDRSTWPCGYCWDIVGM